MQTTQERPSILECKKRSLDWSEKLACDFKCLTARRRFGGFMRHKIEVTAGDHTTMLIGGVMSGRGTISIRFSKTVSVTQPIGEMISKLTVNSPSS